MSTYYAYTRVSTQRQGEIGVSLQEQRDAISRYAAQHRLTVSAWFEERRSAAKGGRPVFNQMLKDLWKKKIRGVIIHKIDRSARNLSDWAMLGELIDQGVVIHFAAEWFDLTSRGGRLAADIQAVVAADFIRNLRDEVKKGFYGRLKQGLFPLPAPLGYLNCGAGKPKAIDPVAGPLVRLAYELYATGEYSLLTLNEELFRLGFRNNQGAKLTLSGLARILRNPFYIGLLSINHSESCFPGIHIPLVTAPLFDRVQIILKGRKRHQTRLSLCPHSLLPSL